MYAKIEIYFKKDLGRPQFVPHYFYKTIDAVGIFECISMHTGDDDLAANVAGWADLAAIGEEYDTDTMHAEIVDE